MSGTNAHGETNTQGDTNAQGETNTGQGAPTDKAHEDAGDGSLQGSVPAGLTTDELLEQANAPKTDDGGTG